MNSSARDVNNILQTLRAEHFRHSQNLLRSRTHLDQQASTHSLRTLPLEVTHFLADENVKITRSLTPAESNTDSLEWRAGALSVVLPCTSIISASNSDIHSVPPLPLLCLRVLLSSTSGPEFSNDIAPCIPSHLRRDILRYTALHSPLPNSKLYALFEPEGHSDGEIIVVGPRATLRSDYIQETRNRVAPQSSSGVEVAVEEWSWDSNNLHDEHTLNPLHTLILLSCPLTVSTFLDFPRTITHLGLINLPLSALSIPIHRLPGICPLLEVLDLSYNQWLGPASSHADKILERVGWNRWNRLRVLGLRGCRLNAEILGKVNQARWNDVLIIRFHMDVLTDYNA